MNPEALTRTGRRLWWLYFEAGWFGALAAFSTFMSSPWTIERTAKSADASEATVKYTWMAHVMNVAGGLVISIGAGNLGALFGTVAGTSVMGFIYRYSRQQGLEKASFDIGGFDVAAALAGRRR